MTIELQTGNQADVTSASDAELYASMFGDGNYILRNPLELKMEDANTLSVGSGNASQNGRHIRFKGSTEFTIPSGTQAQKRSHLAVVRTTITRDDETMQTIEKSEGIVLSGEPTMDGTPNDPEIIEGNLLRGDTIADFPIARVITDGINALDPVPLFEVLPSYASFRDSQYQTLENGWHVRRYPDGWADCWKLQHAVKQSTFQFVTTELPFAQLDDEVVISLNAFVEGDSETCALSPYLTAKTVSCYVRSSSHTQAGTRIRVYWSLRMRWK